MSMCLRPGNQKNHAIKEANKVYLSLLASSLLSLPEEGYLKYSALFLAQSHQAVTEYRIPLFFVPLVYALCLVSYSKIGCKIEFSFRDVVVEKASILEYTKRIQFLGRTLWP